MKHALLFLERNMGSGYAHAYPPTNPILSWWLNTRVLPQARKVLEHDGQSVNFGASRVSSEFPSEGTTSLFMDRRFVVYSLLVQPDTRCTDPRARERNPKFTLHAVFPVNLNFISGPFQAFLAKCRSIGWNTLQPGRVESLRIPIPDNLFLKTH